MLPPLTTLRHELEREASLLKRIASTRLLARAPEHQSVVVIRDLLPTEQYESLRDLGLAHKDRFVRQKSIIRDGAAIDLHELQSSPCAPLVDALVNSAVLERVQARTQRPRMNYVDPTDTNQISLLYYGEPGDGIDWHYDGTIYLGERWAGIYTLHETSHTECSALELMPNGVPQKLPQRGLGNSLILFQGDSVKHRVRPTLPGEERLVANLLFATSPQQSRNPLLHLSQRAVNYAFYGKLKHRRAR